MKLFTEVGACVSCAASRSILIQKAVTIANANPPPISASPMASRYHGTSITTRSRLATSVFVAGGVTTGAATGGGGATGSTGSGLGGGVSNGFGSANGLPQRSMPAAAFFASASGGFAARNLRYASTACSQSPASRRASASLNNKNFAFGSSLNAPANSAAASS